MKKFLASLSFVTMACLVITFFYMTSTVKGTTILPDKSAIQAQIHMSKINELTKNVSINKQLPVIDNYLSTLSAKELLETVAEYSEPVLSAQDRSDFYSIVAPHLSKAWQQGIPYDDVSNIIKDKTYNSNFRMFMVDAATVFNGKAGQSNAEIIDSIYSIAQDNNENTELRRHSLLDLTESSISLNATEKLILGDIFRDPDSPPEVKSAVISAMRRIQDPKFKETVIPILEDLKSYPSIIIRHAVTEAATDGISAGYITQLADLAKSTMDQEVYGSTILALGINGGKEAVNAIVSNFGRFNNTDMIPVQKPSKFLV